MNENDASWDALASAWASAPVEGDSPIGRIVDRHRRRLLIVAAGEIALVLAFAVMSALFVANGVESWEAIWLLTLWMFTAVAVAFAWWNRRETWSTAGRSVADYVRLTRLRATRQRRSIIFVIALVLAEIAAIVVQLVIFDRFTMTAGLLLAGSAAVTTVWCVAAKRRIDRERQMIAEYEDVA